MAKAPDVELMTFYVEYTYHSIDLHGIIVNYTHDLP